MPEVEKITFPCIKITQPLGEFYIGSLDADSLCDISWSDVRRIEGERGFETYLGIQRPLRKNRVKELQSYVNSPDACFPTAVILSVPAECVEFDTSKNEMTLFEGEDNDGNAIPFDQIAKVIDGQHRIEGLRGFQGEEFKVNVSIFVDIDVSDQAYLFSTVNLAQTKVNKSLVYDLYDLAKSRSPQKTCHNIAVALDEHEKSPLHHRVKRLGVSTEGRFTETITQATFVQSLMKYISRDPLHDRSLYLKRKKPELANANELNRLIFRNMFIEERDLDITDIVWNYFEAISKRWPEGWNNFGKGLMLNKTNGFKAFMRFLRPVYLYITSPGEIPSVQDFSRVLKRIDMSDDEFNTDAFKPGAAGEGALYRRLIELSQIENN